MIQINQLINYCFTLPRRTLGLVAFFCALILGVGFVLQYAVGLTPCPLCIIQRFFFGGVGVVALMGYLHGQYSKVYSGVMFALALLGGGVALRNVYIQLTPRGLDTQCIPWLHSFTDMIQTIFQATGDCSARTWTLLGLSIPEWSLIAFLFLIGVSSWLLLRREPATVQSLS